MSPVRHCVLASALALVGCAAPSGSVPSLTPRAAEAIDPRVPVVTAATSQPASPALAVRLAELISQARSGESAFALAVAEAQRLAAVASPAQSETWVVAQEAVSAAVAARAPATQALGDIDGIAAMELTTNGGISPADFAAIEAAAGEVKAIDQRQAEIIASLQRRLGG
jgi:hypothetical protein